MELTYPVSFSAAIDWKWYAARGHVEISPGLFAINFGPRAMAMSTENRVVHQGNVVHVFRVNNKPFGATATLVCESENKRVFARPSYRSAETVLTALRECGFTVEVEKVAPLLAIVPYYLRWKMRAVDATAKP
jgi:hypothetical protein